MPATAVPAIVEPAEVPKWKSPNELIHERINFDDTIWGFGLAGGAYYNTPLRITYVRSGSRAEKANIYPGDVVLKINGIDSSKLTLEQAHDMILESGIHLMINVTSPDDEEDSYTCYQDPLEEAAEAEAKAKANKSKPRKAPKPSGKSSLWGLQWPWKCKRKIIYKESNCYLVPSKYEEKHKDSRKAPIKQDDEIVLDSIHNVKMRSNPTQIKEDLSNVTNSDNNNENKSESVAEDKVKDHNNSLSIGNDDATKPNNSNASTEVIDSTNKNAVEEQNSSINENKDDDITKHNSSADNIEELSIKQDVFLESNDKNDAEEPINTLNNKNEDSAKENNGSIYNANEDGKGKQISPVNKIHETEVAEPNNSVDLNKNITELTNSKNIDVIEDDIKTNDTIEQNESVRFENGDIPGVSESVENIHNSR